MKKLLQTKTGSVIGVLSGFAGIILSVVFGTASSTKVYVEYMNEGILYSDNVILYAGDGNLWMIIPGVLSLFLMLYTLAIIDEDKD